MESWTFLAFGINSILTLALAVAALIFYKQN